MTLIKIDGKKFMRHRRLTNAQRKENVKKKIAEFLASRK